MTSWARSLRLRLLLAGLVAAGLMLAAAMAGLSLLFERHAERQLARELSALAEGIAAQIDRPAGGDWALSAPPGDPRYDRPLSGFYWQVSRAAGGPPLLQSRSLWDATLTAPAGAPTDETLFPLAGPGGEALLALSLPVTMPARLGGERLVVLAARDAAELREAAANFRRDLLPFLGVIALALLAAFAAQVAVGLAPLRRMRARLIAIGSGRAARLGEEGFPSEILPLARELDGLLAQRERDIAAARARAGDLAHGLKTPIQVLLAEAERLEWPMTEEERRETATAVGEATEAMRRHVERELSRARRALRGRADRADPVRVARRLVAVLARTEAGARLDWAVEGAEGSEAAIHEDDLAEALGAVMENAARFARESVRVTITRDGPGVAITVTDDGPGLPPESHAEALRRGGRLDEAGPGTGLGLAIAREILEEVGGALGLGPTAPGAMTVTLRLPAG
ncbi:HAMP domain-containing histidine kinase [Roseococcus sp. SDR]|uniref:sensor histidine kinase n=1 Tax=Roseococcus sp. SDR TaxID=2835532 RepID=UPI001BCB5FFC|nr:HAMP domain-containing sensor histidine kinase [Roseococcus sp. SDR]MBS7790977.1 HAMP domain-containing histidine kinase [Roseococcus sp. SDR]MBV1846291.1 HAMP domain-containing histidine kinase [Roseococcus sp. SDR]